MISATPTDERLPAYLRLRDRLAARVAAGEWTHGKPLPSENALAREHALSVGTVRRAVQQLVDEGLLERRQGSGTFLKKPAFDATLFRFFQLREEGADGASIPQSAIRSREVVQAPPRLAELLGADELIRIERVRSLSGRPLLAEEIHISAARFPGFVSLPASELGPLLYPVYLDRFGVFVARAEDEVTFAAADRATAETLEIAPDDPIAVIERTAFAFDGSAVEWRIAKGSAARFRYRSRIG